MRHSLAVFMLLIVVATCFAQTKTGKKYVTGIVEPNNHGLITIRRWPGNTVSAVLSYPQKSFATVRIGDKMFTNNHAGTNITNDSRFGGFLDNGTTQKIGDTIRTTWLDKNGCDIIQEIYPVLLEASEQIVMRWKLKNNKPAAVTCQNQFLLDLQVGGQNPNDGAPILTSYGYSTKWQQFKNDQQPYGFPWFFAAFENMLPNSPTFDPGISAAGYTHDVMYKLSLKRPSFMVYGDWARQAGISALVDFLWGVSPQAQWGQSATDAAILYQWDPLTIPSGQTLELGSTSYGTGEFTTCVGQLMGVVFYPHRFEWQDPKYSPDTARVEFYGFDVYSPLPQDPNFGPPSVNTHIKLHVGPNLRIIAPDTARSLNHRNQRQQTNPSTIPQYGVGSAMWKIVADKAINCNDDLNSWLKFTAESSLSGTGPIFFNSGDGDTCEHKLVIECSVKDTIPPAIVNLDTSPRNGKYTRTFSIVDSRFGDMGIDSLKWKPTPGSGTDISKFVLTVYNKPLTPCTRDTHTVWLIQSDSALAGCIDITVTDCALNDTTITLCFSAHPYIAEPDTIPPVVTLDSSNKRKLRINFSDKGIHDLGMGALNIEAAPGTDNSKFTTGIVFPAPDSCSKKQHAYTITQLDTNISGCFLISGVDCAGNVTPTYKHCFPEPQLGIESGSGAEGCDLIINPATDRTMLRVELRSAQAVTIRVVDIAGKECAVFKHSFVTGTNEVLVPTADLAAGTYYVIAEWNGRQYAKKLQVIK